MNDETKFELKPLFQVRLGEEDRATYQEYLWEIMPEIEPANATPKIILVKLFEKALMKVRKQSEPRKEDADAIQNLTNEIGRLKILNDQLNESYIEASGLNNAAKQAIDELTAQLQDAIDNITPLPADNQVLITIPPIIRKVLEIEAATAKKKTGKEFSISEILINSFWESVEVGRVYPFRSWTKGELSNLAKQLQSAAE